MTEPEVDFRPADPGSRPASDLLEAMVAEMVELYDIPAGVDVGTPLAVREMAPPSGRFVVGWVGDQPVAGGGIRACPAQPAPTEISAASSGAASGRQLPEMCEIKRMYVLPAWRGRGLATGLLAALEDAAAQLGYRIVRLDTGHRQPQAQRLYVRMGYQPIDDYNGNPHAAFWGEKYLAAPDRGAEDRGSS